MQKRLAVAEDEAERHALDREFHSTLCEASGNEALAALADVLRTRGSHYSIYGAAEADIIRLASDLGHEELINAMAARDPAAAAASATAHLSQTEVWLRRYAPLPDDGPAAGWAARMPDEPLGRRMSRTGLSRRCPCARRPRRYGAGAPGRPPAAARSTPPPPRTAHGG
ncbi:FCD domain-containing protein [Streptomyces rhizosphaericus]|uniref:GntR C-terminal domain-containing protein n=1 Tax=Streptomyces rhizosphaericus TaxID=114699 RepID=A0ABN1R1X3_9ACTN